MPRPELAALGVADPPEPWRALGFAVTGGDRIILGGVELELGSGGSGLTGWTLRHLDLGDSGDCGDDIDGLPTAVTTAGPPAAAEHPNGATGIDHVVIVTPDFDRTASALAGRGIPLRRIRESGDHRQGFRRLGPAIMEIVESPKLPAGPARLWGMVMIVPDLHALHESLASHLGEPRPAVQPGRQIATLANSAGLSPQIAFMDPE
jgi:hypothetical protein